MRIIARGIRIVGLATLAVLASRSPVYGDSPTNSKTPIDLEKETPKGKLSNPYKDSSSDIVSQGAALFSSYACAGCHGGGGGGDMCPPVTNGVWIYGGDDDTLFRLVTLGSDALQAKGYKRIAIENVVAPMPPMGGVVKTSSDLWKIITFIRSRYDGDPAYKFGSPASAH